MGWRVAAVIVVDEILQSRYFDVVAIALMGFENGFDQLCALRRILSLRRCSRCITASAVVELCSVNQYTDVCGKDGEDEHHEARAREFEQDASVT